MTGVEIGGYEIRDVIVSYVSEEYSDNTFHEAMIGLGLLSRFNLVFDYSRRRMYVEPNHTFADPFDYNMTGIWMRRGRGPYFEVKHVQPDSPAGEAGMRIGDRILQINGKDVGEYTVWELRPILRQEGNTVTLTVQRDNEQNEIALKLRRVI